MLVTPRQPMRLDRVLAASLPFRGLDDALLGQIAQSATVRRYARGERVFQAGTPATQLVLIQTGILKIVRHGADGSDSIVGLFGPREAVGLVAVLERGRYPADALVASEDASVVRVEAEPLLAAIEKHAEVARSMNRALVEHNRALETKIRVVTAGSVPKRLATLLLCLVDRFGDEHEDGAITIPVPISRGELACLIGARVETTIRTIRKWEKLGDVETQPDGFRIHDLSALVRLTRGQDDDAADAARPSEADV